MWRKIAVSSTIQNVISTHAPLWCCPRQSDQAADDMIEPAARETARPYGIFHILEHNLQCGAYVHVNRIFLPIKTAYFLYFAALVSISPYLPVYMTYLGLTATQVGIISTMDPLSNLIICTLLGMVADRYALHKMFLILGVVIPALVYSAMYFVPHVEQIPWTPIIENTTNQHITNHVLVTPMNTPHGVIPTTEIHTTPNPKINLVITFWVILMLSIIGPSFSRPFFTVMDSSTQKLVQEHGGEFGRQRLWGAIAWGIWSPVAGLAIDSFQPTTILSNKYTPIFIMQATFALLCIIPVLMIKLPAHERPQSMSRQIFSLFSQPLFLMFVITTFVCGATLGIISTYLFIFLQDDLNSPHYLMGLTLTLTCMAEVPVMFYAKKIIALLGYANAMNLVLFTWGLRCFLYSTLQSAFWVLPVELLHGITFGLYNPAYTSFINWISPDGMQTSVQALCNGIWIGLGFGSGMLCGGFVYDTYGGRNLFRAAAVMCIGTFIFMVMAQCALRRRTDTPADAQHLA
ncbi:major facilitator superfamily domain-containing protein 6-A-like [Amphiura filiformis]|uniref:major facilitator superfamily domain-containing protein 6-A-like n=1 Tax=Amphiura filiformis TaxID=82378 RepID=UPI003B215D82